jgi:hypothetical protein
MFESAIRFCCSIQWPMIGLVTEVTPICDSRISSRPAAAANYVTAAPPGVN